MHTPANAPDACSPRSCANTSRRASRCLVAAGQRGRARRVVGHGAQHPRPARGRRVRPAAAYLGRTHSDRPRLPLLRRPAARIEAVGADGERGRSPAPARQRRHRLSTRCCRRSRTCVSQASRHVGFAIRPAHEAAVFDRVEFIPLGATRVLVVIVARGGHVIQKVIDVGEPLDADELRQAANYLNVEFSGLPLHRAREAVLERMQRGAAALRRAAWRARCASPRRPSRTCPTSATLYVDGAASLLGDDAGPDAQHAAGAAADDRGEAAARAAAERIHRRPGSHGRHRRRASRSEPAARSASWPRPTTTAPGIGTIGVIGPTRMRYSRAIAVVDGAAQAVSRVLRDPN